MSRDQPSANSFALSSILTFVKKKFQQKKLVLTENIAGKDPSIQSTINQLKLSPQSVKAIHYLFNKIDYLGIEYVHLKDIAHYYQENHALIMHIFLVVINHDNYLFRSANDVDNNNKDNDLFITFLEFLMAVWNFFTISDEQLPYLVFEMIYSMKRKLTLIDEQRVNGQTPKTKLNDPTPRIPQEAVLSFISILHGCGALTLRTAQPQVTTAFEELESRYYDSLKSEEFVEWCANNMIVLKPLQAMKSRMLMKPLGMEFWNQLTIERYAANNEIREWRLIELLMNQVMMKTIDHMNYLIDKGIIRTKKGAKQDKYKHDYQPGVYRDKNNKGHFVNNSSTELVDPEIQAHVENMVLDIGSPVRRRSSIFGSPKRNSFTKRIRPSFSASSPILPLSPSVPSSRKQLGNNSTAELASSYTTLKLLYLNSAQSQPESLEPSIESKHHEQYEFTPKNTVSKKLFLDTKMLAVEELQNE